MNGEAQDLQEALDHTIKIYNMFRVGALLFVICNMAGRPNGGNFSGCCVLKCLLIKAASELLRSGLDTTVGQVFVEDVGSDFFESSFVRISLDGRLDSSVMISVQHVADHSRHLRAYTKNGFDLYIISVMTAISRQSLRAVNVLLFHKLRRGDWSVNVVFFETGWCVLRTMLSIYFSQSGPDTSITAPFFDLDLRFFFFFFPTPTPVAKLLTGSSSSCSLSPSSGIESLPSPTQLTFFGGSDVVSCITNCWDLPLSSAKVAAKGSSDKLPLAAFEDWDFSIINVVAMITSEHCWVQYKIYQLGKSYQRRELVSKYDHWLQTMVNEMPAQQVMSHTIDTIEKRRKVFHCASKVEVGHMLRVTQVQSEYKSRTSGMLFIAEGSKLA